MKMINRITPPKIESLEFNEVFVFGSNDQGIHGKGAALFAKQKCGAIQSQARGFQGQSYAIVTKKNWRVQRSSTLQEIESEILEFEIFASEHPELTFYVTKLGTENAGYSIKEIAPLFIEATQIKNIKLPVEFWDVINEMNFPHEEPSEDEISRARRMVEESDFVFSIKSKPIK